MNGSQLYEFVTNLLGGIVMEEDLFVTLVNLAKSKRESMRDWACLKKKSTSIQWLAGDSADVSKTTPTDMLRPIRGTDKVAPIALLGSDGRKKSGAIEIPFERQYDYAGIPGYFFIDYGAALRPLYFTAPAPETMTAALFYLAKSDDIEVADLSGDTWTWGMFASRFAPILGYDVAIMHKGDIDFDDINARMVQFSGRTLADLEFAMIMEDERIKLSSLGV